MDRIRGGTLSAGVVRKIEWNPRGARLLKGCDGSLLKVLTMNEYGDRKRKRMLTKVTKFTTGVLAAGQRVGDRRSDFPTHSGLPAVPDTKAVSSTVPRLGRLRRNRRERYHAEWLRVLVRTHLCWMNSRRTGCLKPKRSPRAGPSGACACCNVLRGTRNDEWRGRRYFRSEVLHPRSRVSIPLRPDRTDRHGSWDGNRRREPERQVRAPGLR